MAKHLDDPNASYNSLTKTIRKAFNDAGIKNIDIDEIFPAKTGQLTYAKGSGVYNQFVQFIDDEINQKAKRSFDGTMSSRLTKLTDEYKLAQKTEDYSKVEKILEKHEGAIEKFYENNPKAKGKVNLTQFQWDAKNKKFLNPKQVFESQYKGSYKTIPSKIRAGMEKFYGKTGISIDPGTARTLEKSSLDVKALTQGNAWNKAIKSSKAKMLAKTLQLDMSAANQKKLLHAYKNAGIGGHCRWKKSEGGRIGFADGSGYERCIAQAIEDNKKAMQSTDESTRAAAIFKNRKAINAAKKIPQFAKLLRRGIQVGKTGLSWALGGWNIPIETIVEGGIYEYYRREGYTHDQAFAETFTPRLLTEGAEGKSTEDVPWYGGAEKLREKELYEIRGENEFMDVDNRPPMQDPEFGQLLGERGSVKRYIDNMAALDKVTSEYYTTHDHLAAAKSGRVKIDPETIERLQTKLKELEAEGLRLHNLTKKGTSDFQLYQTQLEKQQTEQGQRAIEYGEWGQGDTERLAKQREKRRLREMKEKFPLMSTGELNKILEDQGLYVDPRRRYKGQTVQKPKGLKFLPGWTVDKARDYFRDLDKSAYFAENFRTEKAGGGIAGIRRPNAIPPESGPTPYGLPSMYNRVRRI